MDDRFHSLYGQSNFAHGRTYPDRGGEEILTVSVGKWPLQQMTESRLEELCR